MGKHGATAVKLSLAANPRDASLTERLNMKVLQTLRDLATEIQTDPGIEDEYEFFEDPRDEKRKKTRANTSSDPHTDSSLR